MKAICSGMGIVNPIINRPGTVGLVATYGGLQYIVSCYHVLCRLVPAKPFTKDEPIYLTDDADKLSPVAFVDQGVAALDIAAARVADGVEAVGGMLGFGTLATPAAPCEGMLVVKFGHATGLTEGRISRIDGDDVWIEADGDGDAMISAGGDSGAVWVCRESRAPVVLHTGTDDSGMVVSARGVSLIQALKALNLAGLEMVCG